MPLSHVPYLDTNEFFSMQCTLGSLRARNVLIVSSDQFFSSERNHAEFIL